MAVQGHVDKLQQGVDTWNAWRKKHPENKIDLSGADLSDADLGEAILIRANLSGADLSNARLSNARLSGAILSGAILSDAILSGANLSRAILSEAILSDADLGGAILIRANLSFAILRGAILREAILRGAILSFAILSGAILRGAILSDAILSRADLSEASLSEASLSEASLSNADLRRADLRRADLRRADFSGADLSGADLSGATVGFTIFGNLDLQAVKGLETIRHNAPSTIGTDTLERSGGHLPDLFLKGAGLSDTFITYLHSLVHTPIEYYTCFISYSSKDEVFAKRLHNDLQQEGVRCWFAPEDMDIGDKIQKRIDESIRLYDKLLLILSEHSIASSWVAYEVECALLKEPRGIPNVLYPVRVDQAVMTCTAEWAHDIRSTRHIGDFEEWTDPQHYEANFKRLLRALNTKKEQQKK